MAAWSFSNWADDVSIIAICETGDAHSERWKKCVAVVLVTYKPHNALLRTLTSLLFVAQVISVSVLTHQATQWYPAHSHHPVRLRPPYFGWTDT